MKTLGPPLLFSALCVVVPARASTTYPKELEKYLGIHGLPAPGMACTLCHRNDMGGPLTVVTPFGRTLRKLGAAGANIPSLKAALDAADADRPDSDQDGEADLDELRAGTNPNVADGMTEGPPLKQVPLPETGCSLAGAPKRADAVAGLLAALLLASLRRRR